MYGDGLNVREWLYVEDNCEGTLKVLEEGKAGEVYNISSGNEMTNLDITRTILKIMAKPERLIKFVEDRPGHDRRYALDSTKIKNQLGWKPKMNFDDGIQRTIEWYLNHRDWLDNVKSGEYRRFYEKHYHNRR